jgi:hypothetical protein
MTRKGVPRWNRAGTVPTHLTTRKFRFVIGEFCDKQLIAASFADFNLYWIALAGEGQFSERKPSFFLTAKRMMREKIAEESGTANYEPSTPRVGSLVDAEKPYSGRERNLSSPQAAIEFFREFFVFFWLCRGVSLKPKEKPFNVRSYIGTGIYGMFLSTWGRPAKQQKFRKCRLANAHGAIPLPGVQGRIDHFAFEPKNRFVSALGNNSVEVLDPRA